MPPARSPGPSAPVAPVVRRSRRTSAPGAGRRRPVRRASSADRSSRARLRGRAAVGEPQRLGHAHQHLPLAGERLPAVRGADVVHEQQIPGLPGLAPGVRLVGGVEQLDHLLADRASVAVTGVERQPVRAVLVHQVLAHLGGQCPLVEERDLVEPAAPARDRVPYDGAAALRGVQRAVRPPGELDGVLPAVALDLGPVLGAERLGQGRPDLVVVAAGQQPALALEPLGERGGQRLQHPRGVGHRRRPALLGRGRAGEHHQAGHVQGVTQLVVHAHRLVGRPGSGGVQAPAEVLAGRERLALRHEFTGEPAEDGAGAVRVAQSETTHEQRPVLGDHGAQRLAVLGRPGRGVRRGVDAQQRGSVRPQLHIERRGQGRERHLGFLSVARLEGPAGSGRGQGHGGPQHGPRRLGRPGAREVVAPVGEFVQLHLFGQAQPVPVERCGSGGVRVVGRDDHGDRRGQPGRLRGAQGRAEVVVRGHAVVPVGGADVLGVRLVQLGEFGVAAVRGEPGRDLGVAESAEFRDGRGPLLGGAEELGADEHPGDPHAPVREAPGGLDRRRGSRGVAPQHHPGQSARDDLRADLLGDLRDRGERLLVRGHVVARQVHREDGEPAVRERARQRPEVDRVAARVGEAHQRVLAAVPVGERLQQLPVPAGRAVQQGGQVGEDRGAGDVLEGHRPLQRDAELDRGQRGAAGLEEVVGAADLFGGYAQHRRPGRREPPLGRAERRLPGLRHGRRGLLGQGGQRLAVDLAVGGQRQGVLPVVARGDHIGGENRAERLAQLLGRPGRTRAEGDQVLAPAGPLGDHHRRVPYPGQPQQRVLDLPDLDAEAADLHLVVPAAQELQLAVRVPAPPVTAQVEPFTGPVRVRAVRLPGPLRVVDVPAAHTDTGERDQTRRAQRHQPQPLVHDEDAYVVHRASQQHPLRHPVQDLVVGVVRRLGQAVGVEQPDARLDREPALHQLPLERLAGHRHTAQVRQFARVLLQVGDHDLQIGGHELGHRDPPVGQRVHEALHVRDHVLRDQQGAAADQQRGHQLPQGDVEALGRGLRHHRALADPQVVDLGEEVVEQARVLAHRPLGLAGGAGGEVDVRQLAGVHRHPRVVLGVRLRVRLRHQQPPRARDRGQRLVQGAGAAGLGEHQPAARARQRRRDAACREVRLDRQVGAARLEHRERRRQPVEVALHDDGDHVLAAQPPVEQCPRQPVGAPVQLVVRPLPPALYGRHGPGVRPDPLLEQLVRPGVGQRPVRSGQPLQLLAHLVGGQQAARVVVGVRVGGQQAERRQVVAADPGGGRRVQDVGAVGQAQHQPAAPFRPAHVQHTVVGVVLVGADRPEHHLVRRLGQPEFAAQLLHRELPVREHLRLGVLGRRRQLPPGPRADGQPAGQRLAPHPGGVAGHHLRLAGQRGQHLGVRGQQQRADRHPLAAHQLAHRRRHLVRYRHLLLGRPGGRARRPARHRGGTPGGQDPLPELPVRFHARSHRKAFLNSRSPQRR
ncbi:hypothetical protein SGPA1_20720 [Streptomyces misionensis JCM 4497]